MVYQVNSKKRIRGFSMVELLIVLVIAGLLFYGSSTIYVNYKSHTSFEVTKLNIVQSLRNAQASAQKTKNDSSWGVKFINGSITVFSGNSYNTRIQNSDIVLEIPKNISVSGNSEIVFQKITGITQNTGTTTISGMGFSNQIYINEKGTITY